MAVRGMGMDQKVSKGIKAHRDGCPLITRYPIRTFFEWLFAETGHILESLEATDANYQASLAEPREGRWHPSRLAKLEQRKSSYDQIVGSHH